MLSYHRESVELDPAKLRNDSLIDDEDAGKFCVRSIGFIVCDLGRLISACRWANIVLELKGHPPVEDINGLFFDGVQQHITCIMSPAKVP